MRLIDVNGTLGGFEDRTVITKEWLNSIEQELGGFIQSRLGRVDYQDYTQLQKSVVNVLEEGASVSSRLVSGQSNTDIDLGLDTYLVVRFNLLLEWKEGDQKRLLFYEAVAGRHPNAPGEQAPKLRELWDKNVNRSGFVPNPFIRNGTLWIEFADVISEVIATTSHFQGIKANV